MNTISCRFSSKGVGSPFSGSFRTQEKQSQERAQELLDRVVEGARAARQVDNLLLDREPDKGKVVVGSSERPLLSWTQAERPQGKSPLRDTASLLMCQGGEASVEFLRDPAGVEHIIERGFNGSLNARLTLDPKKGILTFEEP